MPRNMSANHDNVVVIGEDMDLLVVLIGLCNVSNVYFMKPGKGKTTQRIYSPLGAIDKIAAKHIFFLHAMSGCDTTSALYSQGKRKYLNILAKSTGLQNIVDIFNNPDAAVDEVIKAGLLFLVHLYGFSGKQRLP